MPTRPNIGEFIRPVTIKQKTKVTDTYGKPTVTLSDYKKAYAKMDAIQNDEQVATDRQTVFTRYRVQMHYVSGVTTEMVLYARDTLETFDIVSVIPFERNMFIEMVVQKIIT